MSRSAKVSRSAAEYSGLTSIPSGVLDQGVELIVLQLASGEIIPFFNTRFRKLGHERSFRLFKGTTIVYDLAVVLEIAGLHQLHLTTQLAHISHRPRNLLAELRALHILDLAM